MTRHEIALLNNIADAGIDALGTNYTTSDSLVGATGALVRSAPMHELEFPNTLLAIARAGAGTNNIPLERATDAGIVVFNTPGANANAVKELVICAMLSVARNLLDAVSWVETVKSSATLQNDIEKGKKVFVGHELKGKVLGVIGLGAIGSEVATAAASLGMKVFGYDPYLDPKTAEKLPASVKTTTKLTKLLSQSDFISLHIPLNAQTREIISSDTLAEAKRGVVVLNFARGELVDDSEMGIALKNGVVSRYVTDFPNEITANMAGCVTIPHLGASTVESEINCAVMAAQELTDYLENGNITHSVNLPTCSLGPLKDPARICVMHKNVPNMLASITSVLGSNHININDMSNRAQGNIAYVMFDVAELVDAEIIEKISNIDGVVRVRVL